MSLSESQSKQSGYGQNNGHRSSAIGSVSRSKRTSSISVRSQSISPSRTKSKSRSRSHQQSRFQSLGHVERITPETESITKSVRSESLSKRENVDVFSEALGILVGSYRNSDIFRHPKPNNEIKSYPQSSPGAGTTISQSPSETITTQEQQAKARAAREEAQLKVAKEREREETQLKVAKEREREETQLKVAREREREEQQQITERLRAAELLQKEEEKKQVVNQQTQEQERRIKEEKEKQKQAAEKRRKEEADLTEEIKREEEEEEIRRKEEEENRVYIEESKALDEKYRQLTVAGKAELEKANAAARLRGALWVEQDIRRMLRHSGLSKQRIDQMQDGFNRELLQIRSLSNEEQTQRLDTLRTQVVEELMKVTQYPHVFIISCSNIPITEEERKVLTTSVSDFVLGTYMQKHTYDLAYSLNESKTLVEVPKNNRVWRDLSIVCPGTDFPDSLQIWWHERGHTDAIVLRPQDRATWWAMIGAIVQFTQLHGIGSTLDDRRLYLDSIFAVPKGPVVTSLSEVMERSAIVAFKEVVKPLEFKVAVGQLANVWKLPLSSSRLAFHVQYTKFSNINDDVIVAPGVNEYFLGDLIYRRHDWIKFIDETLGYAHLNKVFPKNELLTQSILTAEVNRFHFPPFSGTERWSHHTKNKYHEAFSMIQSSKPDRELAVRRYLGTRPLLYATLHSPVADRHDLDADLKEDKAVDMICDFIPWLLVLIGRQVFPKLTNPVVAYEHKMDQGKGDFYSMPTIDWTLPLPSGEIMNVHVFRNTKEIHGIYAVMPNTLLSPLFGVVPTIIAIDYSNGGFPFFAQRQLTQWYRTPPGHSSVTMDVPITDLRLHAIVMSIFACNLLVKRGDGSMSQDAIDVEFGSFLAYSITDNGHGNTIRNDLIQLWIKWLLYFGVTTQLPILVDQARLLRERPSFFDDQLLIRLKDEWKWPLLAQVITPPIRELERQKQVAERQKGYQNIFEALQLEMNVKFQCKDELADELAKYRTGIDRLSVQELLLFQANVPLIGRTFVNLGGNIQNYTHFGNGFSRNLVGTKCDAPSIECTWISNSYSEMADPMIGPFVALAIHIVTGDVKGKRNILFSETRMPNLNIGVIFQTSSDIEYILVPDLFSKGSHSTLLSILMRMWLFTRDCKGSIEYTPSSIEVLKPPMVATIWIDFMARAAQYMDLVRYQALMKLSPSDPKETALQDTVDLMQEELSELKDSVVNDRTFMRSNVVTSIKNIMNNFNTPLNEATGIEIRNWMVFIDDIIQLACFIQDIYFTTKIWSESAQSIDTAQAIGQLAGNMTNDEIYIEKNYDQKDRILKAGEIGRLLATNNERYIILLRPILNQLQEMDPLFYPPPILTASGSHLESTSGHWAAVFTLDQLRANAKERSKRRLVACREVTLFRDVLNKCTDAPIDISDASAFQTFYSDVSRNSWNLFIPAFSGHNRRWLGTVSALYYTTSSEAKTVTQPTAKIVASSSSSTSSVFQKMKAAVDRSDAGPWIFKLARNPADEKLVKLEGNAGIGHAVAYIITRIESKSNPIAYQMSYIDSNGKSEGSGAEVDAVNVQLVAEMKKVGVNIESEVKDAHDSCGFLKLPRVSGPQSVTQYDVKELNDEYCSSWSTLFSVLLLSSCVDGTLLAADVHEALLSSMGLEELFHFVRNFTCYQWHFNLKHHLLEFEYAKSIYGSRYTLANPTFAILNTIPFPTPPRLVPPDSSGHRIHESTLEVQYQDGLWEYSCAQMLMAIMRAVHKYNPISVGEIKGDHVRVWNEPVIEAFTWFNQPSGDQKTNIGDAVVRTCDEVSLFILKDVSASIETFETPQLQELKMVADWVVRAGVGHLASLYMNLVWLRKLTEHLIDDIPLKYTGPVDQKTSPYAKMVIKAKEAAAALASLLPLNQHVTYAVLLRHRDSYWNWLRTFGVECKSLSI